DRHTRDPSCGLPMAHAISPRLAQPSSAPIRPPCTFLSLSDPAIDEIEAGHKLQTQYVLTGSFFTADEGFTLNWQLVNIATRTIRAGNTTSVPPFDLIKGQTETTDEIFDTLITLAK